MNMIPLLLGIKWPKMGWHAVKTNQLIKNLVLILIEFSHISKETKKYLPDLINFRAVN